MTKQPVCKTIYPWLRSNLGKHCLAPLTGTDHRALDAAVQIAELYSYCRTKDVAKAFGLVVAEMQEKCRRLAFHSAAHVMDWSDRFQLWDEAGLPEILVGRCAFESQYAERTSHGVVVEDATRTRLSHNGHERSAAA